MFLHSQGRRLSYLLKMDGDREKFGRPNNGQSYHIIVSTDTAPIAKLS